VKLLAEKHHNVCAVGDDDQSIYGWRGADITNILNFEQGFPEAKVIRLEQNYRSTQLILDAAGAVVKHNKSRTGKTLWKAVFAGQAANMNHVCYPYGVYAPQLVTCVAEGRVFAFSSSGRIHCLRASDGKPLWEGNLGPSAERVTRLVNWMPPTV
jgi:outer membrane protein assembly factor BamB